MSVPRASTKARRPVAMLFLALGLTVFASSCTLSENSQYSVTTGTSFYVTVKGPFSAALALIGISCSYNPDCVRDTMNQNVHVEGSGAAQWNEAVNFHSDELANVMRAVADNGGSVNTGGPCIQMWHAFFGGNAGFNYVPRENSDCQQ